MSTAKTTATAEVKTSLIASRLDAEYGPRRWRRHGDPLDELVATILSQHTSDVNSGRAFSELKAQFPDWIDLVDAPVDAVASAIQRGGLANIKAPRIQAAVDQALKRFPDADFSSLPLMRVSDARNELCRLPGIGPKTASCILLFSLGAPAMPVDTHVHRVAIRTGIIESSTSAERAHDILESRLGIDVDAVYSFHVNTIQHGRRVCKARGPACGQCCLNDLCDFASESHG